MESDTENLRCPEWVETQVTALLSNVSTVFLELRELRTIVVHSLVDILVAQRVQDEVRH